MRARRALSHGLEGPVIGNGLNGSWWTSKPPWRRRIAAASAVRALGVLGAFGVGDHAAFDGVAAANRESDLIFAEAGFAQLVGGQFGLVAVVEDRDQCR